MATTAMAKLGVVLKFSDTKSVTLSEGDSLTNMVYGSGDTMKTISGRVRVINAETKSNTTIPSDCPPEPYAHRYITVRSLTIDSSEVFDAEMTRISVGEIQSIEKVNDEYATPDFEVNGAVYYTIEEALAAAAADDVIKMTRNTDLTVAIPAGVTLDVESGYTLNIPPETAPDVMAAGGTVKINAGASLMLNNEVIIGPTGRMVITSGAVTLNLATKAISVVSGSVVKVPTGKTMYMLLDFKNGTRVALGGIVESGGQCVVEGTVKLPSLDAGSTFLVNGELNVAENGMVQVAAKAKLEGSGKVVCAGAMTFAKATSAEAVLACKTELVDAGKVYSQLAADLTSVIPGSVKSTGSFTVDGVVDSSGAPVVFTTLYQAV